MTTPLPNKWTYPPASTPRWSESLGLLTILLWVTVLALWFFSGLLWSRIWILAAYIDVAVRAVALLVTAFWVGSLLRHRRWFSALLEMGFTLGIAGVVMLDVWTEVYPRVWFWSHRNAFVAAERLARAGSLDGDIHDYMGAPLPAGLADISVDGNLVTTSAFTDDGESDDVCGANRPILLAPAWMGIPDGATGFVHIPCDAPTGLLLDGYSDDMCPNYPLADGWWWADGVSCNLGYD